jgi:hypothetical protein
MPAMASVWSVMTMRTPPTPEVVRHVAQARRTIIGIGMA